MSMIHQPSSRCAACKCLRRKCAPDCILAPHFPSSNPQRFASVHKVFGAANITKMLQQVPVHLRGRAAKCIEFEAGMRMRDSVYGSVGIISQLQQQITKVQNEILKTQGEIALQKVHQHRHESEVGSDFGLQLNTINGLSNLEEGSGQFYAFVGDLDNHLFTEFN